MVSNTVGPVGVTVAFKNYISMQCLQLCIQDVASSSETLTMLS